MPKLDIQPLDYTGIPEGYFRLGIVVPTYNCVAEKIVGEMTEPLREQHARVIMTTEDKTKNLTEYFPDAILYLRCGTGPNTPPNILAAVDGLLNYWRSLHVPVYYYLDDAFFMANNWAPLKILMHSDETIVATDALVRSIQEAGYTNPIHLLKTHMDVPMFDAIPPANLVVERDKFNILFTSEGRIGTVMLDKICERMAQSPEKYANVRLLCITSQVAMLRAAINRWRGPLKVYYERVPLVEYYGIFKMVDLCIAPGDPEDLNYFLDEKYRSHWLASKSCVKYTIAGAAGIPCIASPNLEEYAKAIKHGENGYIATNIDEWIQYIDLMIENETERKKIGMAARKDVMLNWHISKRTAQLLNIVKGQSDCLVPSMDPEQRPAEPLYQLPME